MYVLKESGQETGLLDQHGFARHVGTEGAAAADDLTDINVTANKNGMILRLWAVNEARVITVKHSSTLQLAGEVDRVLSQHGYLELKRNGSYWQETPRKDVLELRATYTANNTYSTSEVDTGKKWIDGKTIYRKVVATGALPNNTTKTVAHGITSLAGITQLYGVAYRSDTKTTATLPYAHPSASSTVSLGIDLETINMVASGNLSVFSTSYVTIEYTKTS